MLRTRQFFLAAAFMLAGSSLAVPAGADSRTAGYDAITIVHPAFTYGRANTIDVRFEFEFGTPLLTLDPAALHVDMRRVDGTVRMWKTLAPVADSSDAQHSTALLGIPAVRGATYEFSVDATRAVVPVGAGPSESAVADARRAFTEFKDTGLAAHEVWLLTIPSEPIASPDLALARVQKVFTAHVASVVRAPLMLYGDYGSPHAPPFAAPLARGDRVKIGTIARGGFESTSTGALGIPAGAGLPSEMTRYSMDAVHVTVASEVTVAQKTSEPPNDLWLTFASPDEMLLYVRSTTP